MHFPVEVNLRVPSLQMRATGEPLTVNNQHVRFRRVLVFDAALRPGALLTLVAGGQEFEAEVLRVEWSESASGFVADCRYSKPRILPSLYEALVGDSSWAQWSMP